MGFLMPPNPLTNFEIQKYDENGPRFNGDFSRDNMRKKIKDGAYVINLSANITKESSVYFVQLISKYAWVVPFKR